MNKSTRFLCLALAVLLAAMLLTACQPAAEDKTRLDAIKEAGVLVVGTSPDYPPYEFIVAGEDGAMETVGIDMWIARDIAEAIGVELKIEAMDFAGLDSALQMGTIDMIMAAYNPTEDRAEIMDFSEVYYIDTVVALTLAENAQQYTDLSSFSGQKVGVQLGTTLETDYFPQLEGAEKVALKKITQLVPELKAGALAGILVEEPIANAYIANNPDLAIAPLTFDTGAEGYVAALPKDEPEFKAAVDEAIAALVEANTIAGYAEQAQEMQDQAILDE